MAAVVGLAWVLGDLSSLISLVLGHFGVVAGRGHVLATFMAILFIGCWVWCWRHVRAAKEARLAATSPAQSEVLHDMKGLMDGLPAGMDMLRQNLPEALVRMGKTFASHDAARTRGLANLLLVAMQSTGFGGLAVQDASAGLAWKKLERSLKVLLAEHEAKDVADSAPAW